MELFNLRGGINLRLPAWHKELFANRQCLLMQNLRYDNEYVESILGTQKYHGTSLGSDPITAILPYYDDQKDKFVLLVASGDAIYKRNDPANEFEVLASGLTNNSIYSSAIRHGVQYIASINDGLKKYTGGNSLESVGGGTTAPPSFRQVLYMKEIDRLFGISDDAIYGQITWSNIGDPEVWDGANVQRIKLKDGERVEGAEILYGKLIVFCTYSIWIFYVAGNEENWRVEEAPTTIGCVAPNTIKKVGNKIWFLGESPRYSLGVYEFDGSNSTLLTHDVQPFFDGVNRNKLRNACAETHSDLYTISLATGISQVNNETIDLDIVNRKPDGTPAIYGVHTFGFYSSCVLDGRINKKEFLMGDESDGFVYKEGGQTLKSANGTDGQLLQARFISMVHNDDTFEVMKQYEQVRIHFRPRSYFEADLGIYTSTGSLAEYSKFTMDAQSQGYAGDFDVYQSRLSGTAGLYQHIEHLGIDARGTAIQIEIKNSNIGHRIAFDGYSYQVGSIYKVRKAQLYDL